jgi:hypothetical protein
VHAEGGHCAHAPRREETPLRPTLGNRSYSYELHGAAAAGANVDVKKSSYKKLSKLLSTFEKKVWRALASRQ